MNKNDLIAEVARKSGLSRRDAAAAVDAVLDTISGQIRSGETVTITGFGKFGAAHRNPRAGRNPRTGQHIQIPARTVPKFDPGKTLLLAINGDPTSDP